MAKKASVNARFDASMRVVLLHGKESFLKEEATAELGSVLSESFGDYEQFSFEGSSASLADVLDELRSYGLMQCHKLVVVDEADKFLAREGYRKALEAYTKAPVDDATLLLRADGWRPGKIDKLITKVGTKIKCDPLSDAVAVSWCIKRATSTHGREIQRNAAVLLVERLGSSLMRLDTELAKLSAFVGPDDQISRKDVQELVGQSREEQAWVLQSAIMSGRCQEALGKLHELLEISQVPKELVMWAVSDLLRRLHTAAQLLRQGVSPRAIISQLKLWGASGNRIIDVARKGEPNKFAQLLQLAIDTDRRSKVGLGSYIRNVERLTVHVTDTIGCL
ncbi:MAG: DNA polymerase III subunit delta [Planctomycetes bacterium]|nr:DNA polymerase III subunit delta [Planctomycetota bacterium]